MICPKEVYHVIWETNDSYMKQLENKIWQYIYSNKIQAQLFVQQMKRHICMIWNSVWWHKVTAWGIWDFWLFNMKKKSNLKDVYLNYPLAQSKHQLPTWSLIHETLNEFKNTLLPFNGSFAVSSIYSKYSLFFQCPGSLNCIF